MYGHCGQLGHVTRAIWANFCSLILRSLHLNLSSIGLVVSEEKMFENVDERMDSGVIGILIAHLGAFGLGEL